MDIEKKEDVIEAVPINQKTEKIKPLDWILLLLAVIYTLLPIDIIPDIPIIGWLDDSFILSSAFLNILQKKTSKTNETLSAIFKFLKYIAIFLGIAIILLFIFAGAVIVKLIQG
jgi:uncharacterized membrane protein YkvA (DUF1232 family)